MMSLEQTKDDRDEVKRGEKRDAPLLWSSLPAMPPAGNSASGKGMEFEVHEASSPGQILPRTEKRTELTENQNFGYLFGSQFLGIELCLVKSVPPLG